MQMSQVQYRDEIEVGDEPRAEARVEDDELVIELSDHDAHCGALRLRPRLRTPEARRALALAVLGALIEALTNHRDSKEETQP